jgi:hypothetical protein
MSTVNTSYPDGSSLSAMMRAFSSACASVMVVANEFQLFQPIGGVGARTAPAVVVAACAGSAAAAARARELESRVRRFGLNMDRAMNGWAGPSS